ncbi:hypothetical protein FSP39_018711 [Pinctada imbricata]|uniref:Uncharacterized protein n=1 Tax=Pinctada imbricata TaxID=66713 RepID=A0AA89BXS9_PINIB|nr:hypothetical protein FSP39_018711 [Pinctada imbricata]
MASVPDNIKKNVRAVLLSKQGGVLVSDFTKDYKSLLKEQLRFKDLGFSTLKELIDAIPEVVRLEFDDGMMAYKMFGIGDPNTYMSLSAKRAEGRNRGKASPTKSPSSSTTMNGTCSRPDLEDKLIPNMRGHISVCYPRDRELDDASVDDVKEKFSQFGEVAEVHMIPKFIFVRFTDKEAVIASLDRYEKELRLRIAEEKAPSTSNRQQNSSTKADTTESSDSMLVKKSPGGGTCHSCKQTGHFSRECPNKDANDNSSRRKRTEKEPYEVFLNNVACESTEDDLNELLSQFNYKYARRITKDEKRVFTAHFNLALKCFILELYFCRFAFVGFSTQSDAEEMISKLHGYQWKGRALNCRLSRDDKPQTSTQDSKPEEEQPKFSWRGAVNNTSSENHSSQSNTDTQNDWDDDPEDPGLKLKLSVTSSKVNTASPKQTMTDTKPAVSPVKLPSMPSVNATQQPSYNQTSVSPKKASNTQGMFNQFQQLTVQTNFRDGSSSREVKSPMSNHSTRSPQKAVPYQNGVRSPYKSPAMPALQPLESEDPYGEMPPLELAVNETPGEEDIVGLFVGNFPFGMSDEELLEVFRPYDPRHVVVFNRDQSYSSSKAMVYVNGMANARQAIKDWNQNFLYNRRLLVDIDRKHPDYEANKAVYERMESKSQGYNPMYRQQHHMGGYQGNRYNQGYHQNYNQNSYGGYTPRRSPAQSGPVSPTPSNTSVSSTDSIKQRSFTSILQTFKIIMNTLQRRPQAVRPIKGVELLGLITNVYDERNFWVHIVQGVVNPSSVGEPLASKKFGMGRNHRRIKSSKKFKIYTLYTLAQVWGVTKIWI